MGYAQQYLHPIHNPPCQVQNFHWENELDDLTSYSISAQKRLCHKSDSCPYGFSYKKKRIHKAVFFTDQWRKKIIYCSKIYMTVVKECPADLIFKLTETNVHSPACVQGSTSEQTDADKSIDDRVYSIQWKLSQRYFIGMTAKGWTWMLLINQAQKNVPNKNS